MRGDFFPEIIGRPDDRGYGVLTFYMPQWFNKKVAKEVWSGIDHDRLTKAINVSVSGFTFHLSNGKPFNRTVWLLFCECCGVHAIETSGMGGSTGISIDFHKWEEGSDRNELLGHNIDTFDQAVVLMTAWCRYFNLVHSLLKEESKH